METEKREVSELEKRKRKSLLIMPLLVVPFLTLAFWALGGGKVSAVEEQVSKGLNKDLPAANLKNEQGMDKLSYYDLSKEELVKDTASSLQTSFGGTIQKGTNINNLQDYPVTPYYGQSFNDPNEAKVYQKLNQLNQAMSQGSAKDYENNTATKNEDVKKLERMIAQMQQQNIVPADDPETVQLNQMLDKVLDIQYPERVNEKLKTENKARLVQVMAVEKKASSDPITSFGDSDRNHSTTRSKSGFYSVTNDKNDQEQQNVISAVVHETQTLVSGSTIKLRLTEDIAINNIVIPKDNFLYGRVMLNGERLMIKLSGIRVKKSVLPVELSVIDIDGIDGIYIPGAIARDVAKESTDRAIQDVDFGSYSNSIGVQAAGAGLEAAKTLFSRKVKLIKVTVKAGYKLLLRDEKQKQGL